MKIHVDLFKSLDILYILILILGFAYLVSTYLKYIDKEVLSIKNTELNNITIAYESKLDNDFNVINIFEDIKSNVNDDLSSIIYKIDGETFYFVIDVVDELYVISKIVDDDRSINSMMNFKGIKTIEYKTGNNNNATVFKLTSENSYSYFVLTGNSSYFLGSEISEIVYEDSRFYYKTYNPEYEFLKNKEKCGIIKDSDTVNKDDYYLKEGKINFLSDFYQKTDAKVMSVKERCKG